MFMLENTQGIDDKELEKLFEQLKEKCDGKSVLVLPPDHSRLHSEAGKLTAMLYRRVKDSVKKFAVMPALGTHAAMNDEEIDMFFGTEIPKECFLVHDWRHGTVELGEVPAEFINEISEGILNEPIKIEVNRALVSGEYDLVLSIGQVVPHEVIGMANYTKNILVGVGGLDIISKSHFLGAVYGSERMIGRMNTPVRAIFDYAEEHFLRDIPLLYLLTVTTCTDDGVNLNGIYLGRERNIFEKAAALSQKLNITYVKKPIKKCVAWLDPAEFKSTWIANKSIYRTRLAMAEGGELIVLAPAVKQFGEDPENDRLLQKYGYHGREKTLEALKTNEELQNNLAAVSVMIYGSTEGKFRVTYCTDALDGEVFRRAGYNHMSYKEVSEKYRDLKPGYNTLSDGEEVYYVANPAVGLWSLPFTE